MEIFLDIVKDGNVRIELCVYGHQACSVIFTVTDDEDRRILKSSIMENGKIKVYASAEEAISDALRILTSSSDGSTKDENEIVHS